jgi:hypothetical protein
MRRTIRAVPALGSRLAKPRLTGQTEGRLGWPVDSRLRRFRHFKKERSLDGIRRSLRHRGESPVGHRRSLLPRLSFLESERGSLRTTRAILRHAQGGIPRRRARRGFSGGRGGGGRWSGIPHTPLQPGHRRNAPVSGEKVAADHFPPHSPTKDPNRRASGAPSRPIFGHSNYPRAGAPGRTADTHPLSFYHRAAA